MGSMSESASPEPVTTPVDTSVREPVQPAVVTTPVVDRRRHSRLTVVAASVGIAAGSVFIVAVIFFSGFVLGARVGGGHHGGRGHDGGRGRDGGEMMRHGDWPDWPGGPGGFGPGSFGPGGPGGSGPGGFGPGGPGGQGPGSLPAPPPGR
jgi:hypothetical protein